MELFGLMAQGKPAIAEYWHYDAEGNLFPVLVKLQVGEQRGVFTGGCSCKCVLLGICQESVFGLGGINLLQWDTQAV